MNDTSTDGATRLGNSSCVTLLSYILVAMLSANGLGEAESVILPIQNLTIPFTLQSMFNLHINQGITNKGFQPRFGVIRFSAF